MYNIVVLFITIYVPLAGGINGGKLAANGELLRTGHAACGYMYDFGTVFYMPDSDGLPLDTVVCIDRGSMITNKNLDIAIVSSHIRQDLQTAFEWGKRERVVYVFGGMYELGQYKKIVGRCE